MLYPALIFLLGGSIHLFFTFTDVFFISPEISLYPYLISQGLTPYRQLIDQHFPSLLFGPFNLSIFSVTTPQAALITFIIVLLLTDLAALLLLRKKLPAPQWPWAFLVFIFMQLLLSSSTFWLESFILLFLLWAVYLFQLKNRLPKLISGFLFGLALSVRPTLLSFFLLFLFFKRSKVSLPFIFVSALAPLLQLAWLTSHQLWPDFMQLMRFNSQYYLPLAAQAPTLRQLIITGFALLLPFLLVKRKKHLLLTAFILLLSVGAYPRFELIHLLPAALSLFLLLPAKINRSWLVGWLLLGSAFTLYHHPFSATNFFYPPSLNQTAHQLEEKLAADRFYLLGGPDQLYQLTDSLPVGDYYLPSLPWYFAHPNFVARQIKVLKNHPQAPVVVNTDSSLNGLSITQYASPILEYLSAQYQKTDSLGPWHIYRAQDAIN